MDGKSMNLFSKTKEQILELLSADKVDKEQALKILLAKSAISKRVAQNRTFSKAPKLRNKVKLTPRQQAIQPRLKTQAGFYDHMECYWGKDE
jgi:hypothetical protein